MDNPVVCTGMKAADSATATSTGNPTALQAGNKSGQAAGIRFREMLIADLPDVMRVEGSCYDFPWSEKNFRDCMNAGYLCFVAETVAEAGKLVGHGILMLGPGEAHVLNICVQPLQRRQGLARTFLHHLVDSARQHEAREVFLEVRESNLAAISLYETAGFNQLTVRRGYYDSNVNGGGREDALIYAMTIRPLNQVTL